MRWQREFTSLIAVCGFVLSLISAQSQDSSANRKAQEEDIFALVIRSQMEDWIREGDKSEAEAKSDSDKSIAKRLNFRVFFVSIKDKDPSDDFIKRFHDIPRIIKKISSEEPAKGPHTPVDKSTHDTGIIFSVDSIRWHSIDRVEVEGGYYCGGLCAAGITFTLQREDGRWVIKNSRMNWIS